MLRPLRAFILFPTPFKGIYFVSYAPSGHLFFTLCPLRAFILYPVPLKGIYSVPYAPQGRLFFPLCPLSEVYCLLARCFLLLGLLADGPAVTLPPSPLTSLPVPTRGV